MDSLEPDIVRIPRLRSARLLFRAFRPGDLDAVAAHFADPESTKFIPPMGRKDAWRVFGSCAGGWVINGAGWWAIETLDTHELVGMVGAFFRDGFADLELGWSVIRAFGGRGFATEAAQRMIQYVVEERTESRVIAVIDRGNDASVQVAVRSGLVFEAETQLYGNPIDRYARALTR